MLYDFCMERQAHLLEIFKKLDADSIGTIHSDDFVEGLQNAGAPLPEEGDLKKILQVGKKK